MTFHSSLQKTHCRIKNPHPNEGKGLFDFYKYIHVAKINSQDTFHSVEKQRSTMKTNLVDFYNGIHNSRNNSLIDFQSIENQ